MSHRLALGQLAPQIHTASGRRTSATKANFPILDGLSISTLEIEGSCFREPHWHANADELAYCTEGTGLVTLFASGNVHAQFTIGAGEMFFIPSGALHAIENTGTSPVKFVIVFSHESAEDFGLSGFAGCLSESVLGNTWGLAEHALDGVTRSSMDIQFGRLAAQPAVPETATYPSPYKFAIETRSPLLGNVHGSAIVARRDTWPVLRKQAMYSLRLEGSGMREPHWHPETAELGYVLQGHARMTVQSPGGTAETYELHPGDIYFIPRAYPHHIENLGGGEIRFLIFFDTPDVQDIGFTGAIPAFSDGLVAPSLSLTPEQCALIPRLPADLLIVPRANPVE